MLKRAQGWRTSPNKSPCGNAGVLKSLARPRDEGRWRATPDFSTSAQTLGLQQLPEQDDAHHQREVGRSGELDRRDRPAWRIF